MPIGFFTLNKRCIVYLECPHPLFVTVIHRRLQTLREEEFELSISRVQGK